jgi:hypothetical protein
MQRQIAMVILDLPVPIDLQAVVDAMRRRYPGVAVEATREWEEEDGSRGHVLHCDGDPVGMLNVPAPLPRDPQAEVWVRAARTWEQASSVEANHSAHVIVARHGGAKDPLREARVITAAIGGLLDVVPECAGVIWSAQVARSAELWKDFSRTAFAPYPDYAIQMWIDVVAERVGAEFDAATVGLCSFIDREIEFEVGRRDIRVVLGNVARLAGYLIERGNVLKDGDMVASSETERIKVRYASSRRTSGMPVLRLEAEGL